MAASGNGYEGLEDVPGFLITSSNSPLSLEVAQPPSRLELRLVRIARQIAAQIETLGRFLRKDKFSKSVRRSTLSERSPIA